MDILVAMLFFLIYSVFILSFGKYGLTQSSNISRFFVADYSLGKWSAVFTFCATWVSVTSFLAISGSFYYDPLPSVLIIIVGWIVGASLLFYVVKVMRRYRLITIPEYFNLRYQSPFLQVIGGTIIAFTHLAYMMLQIYGFGLVLSYLLDIPYLVAIFMVYLFLIYTTFGGLKSIAKTDTINFIWMLSSILILGGIVAFTIHSNDLWSVYFADTFSLEQANPQSGARPISAILSPVSVFLVWVLGKASHTQYLIRVVAVESDKTAREMIGISIFILTTFYLILGFIGTGSAVIVPGIEASDSNEYILLLIRELTQSSLGSFLLIGILASAVSTANSQLLILTSSISYDVIGVLLKDTMNERKMARLNRWIILIGATTALLLTISPTSTFLTLGIYLWGVLAFSFFWMFYGELIWRNISPMAITLSTITGIFTGLTLSFIDIFIFSVGSIHPAIYAMIISGLVLGIVNKNESTVKRLV